MPRRPLIAANWKMNKTSVQAVKFVDEFKHAAETITSAEITICAPFTCLKSLSVVIEYDEPNFSIGAQNVHFEESGAYTGEVSASMLTDLLIKYVIVGHSERRHYFGETDEIVNKKLKRVIEHGMVPIMCVGETLEQHEAGETVAVLQKQLDGGLFGLKPSEVAGMVIAYEPIWAIGTGRTALPEDAAETIHAVRDHVREHFGEQESQSLRILYGGSVNGTNIKTFMAFDDIDGALVGGASLEPASFTEICKF